MSDAALAPARQGGPNEGKFRDPHTTADGQTRASVTLGKLATLWINTGTLCNLTCAHCYIESSPKNDRLVYLTRAEVAAYLDEAMSAEFGTEEIGFTGGEPFMNPDCIGMLEDTLSRGFRALVLTNAMRPMMKCADGLLALREAYGDQLVIRVSLDHFSQALHEQERGARSWTPTLNGIKWLAGNGFNLHVAGRTKWAAPEDELRGGYARLFAEHEVEIDARDPAALVLFPEMDEEAAVPEITTACWGILDVDPNDIMCASSRMIIKRKGEERPVVQACTLLPYDAQFSLGHTLEESEREVFLNHPHCAKFCVLGGGSCSA